MKLLENGNSGHCNQINKNIIIVIINIFELTSKKISDMYEKHGLTKSKSTLISYKNGNTIMILSDLATPEADSLGPLEKSGAQLAADDGGRSPGRSPSGCGAEPAWRRSRNGGCHGGGCCRSAHQARARAAQTISAHFVGAADCPHLRGAPAVVPVLRLPGAHQRLCRKRRHPAYPGSHRGAVRSASHCRCAWAAAVGGLWCTGL